MSYSVRIDRRYGGAAGSEDRLVFEIEYDDADALAKGLAAISGGIVQLGTPEAVGHALGAALANNDKRLLAVLQGKQP